MLSAPSGLDAPDCGGDSGGIREVGGSSGGAAEETGGGGGNRWPREETLALLKIRSDMDAAFPDSSLKGPLWEEASRKMAELGFQRSAKKCKEKFENVYKYNKRTKDGQASKSDGKAYRFFDQLESFQSGPSSSSGHPPPPPQVTAAPIPRSVTVAQPISSDRNFQLLQPPPQATATDASIPPLTHAFQPVTISPCSTPSSSTSTFSDEDLRQRRPGRKRKWKKIFRNLMRDVLRKQEELQQKFLETLERRELDRAAREEAWRAQETARMNREHARLVQERSIAASKVATVTAFLQKVTDQNNFQIPITTTALIPIQPPPQQSNLAPPPPPVAALIPVNNHVGGDNSTRAISSRWPKSEIQALINLRTRLELKYQDNGSKGPLWEEISGGMARLGYSRSAKRCKEKWENINKYYKKVKESNGKRPADSKTCPYYDLLDAIYKEKEARNNVNSSENVMVPNFNDEMVRPDSSGRR